MSISGDASKRSARAHRRALYTLGTLAGLALAVAAMSLPNAAAAAWTALAAMIAAAACSAAWFASVDEVAQRAHHEAWFRGGALALMAAAVFGLHALMTGARWGFVSDLLARVGGDGDAAVAFSMGLGTAFVLAVCGYAFWWALFWLRKRRAPVSCGATGPWLDRGAGRRYASGQWPATDLPAASRT